MKSARRKLAKFLRLRQAERLVLARALLYLIAFRLVIRFVPFRCFRRPPRVAARAIHDPGLLAWAVLAVARALPGSTCLVRALAARCLFARYGHGSELRIGAAIAQQTGFQAHAWLEHGGVVLVGAAARDRYTVLTPP